MATPAHCRDTHRQTSRAPVEWLFDARHRGAGTPGHHGRRALANVAVADVESCDRWFFAPLGRSAASFVNGLRQLRAA
jgi:hypothetical protein